MKPALLLSALLTLTVASVLAQPSGSPAAEASLTAADRDWNALMAFLNAQATRPSDAEKLTPSQEVRQSEALLGKVQDRELAFIDAHPNDARRWEIVVILRRATPKFVSAILPAYDANPMPENLVIDHAALEARIRRIAALEDAMLTAANVPAKLSIAKYRPLFMVRKVTDEVAIAGLKPAGAIDWALLETKLDAFARDFPDDHAGASAEDSYLQLLERKRPDAMLARLQRSVQSPNEDVRKLAQGRLRIETARREPLELAFTAIDGREVKLSSLRGKVVLVDFWATWCGPCIAELPNVKAVYEKYHGQGFEVIGISLDEKADGEKLRRFVQKENLPWPQYHDGRKWKTPIAQDFSITAIPAMLLLGPDGRVVSTQARGPLLGSEVRRLLGRP